MTIFIPAALFIGALFGFVGGLSLARATRRDPDQTPDLRIEVSDPEDYADMVLGRVARTGGFADQVLRARKLTQGGLFLLIGGKPETGLTNQSAHALICASVSGIDGRPVPIIRAPKVDLPMEVQ